MNEERYQRGKQVRESVLGRAHAARTAKNRTSFNAEFQDFLMEYAWGGIWARPGLDHKTRSMITIAMLVGMGKMDELKLHFRATRNTGVSRDEVKELFDARGDLLRRPGRLRRLPARGADLRRDGQ